MLYCPYFFHKSDVDVDVNITNCATFHIVKTHHLSVPTSHLHKSLLFIHIDLLCATALFVCFDEKCCKNHLQRRSLETLPVFFYSWQTSIIQRCDLICFTEILRDKRHILLYLQLSGRTHELDLFLFLWEPIHLGFNVLQLSIFCSQRLIDT